MDVFEYQPLGIRVPYELVEKLHALTSSLRPQVPPADTLPHPEKLPVPFGVYPVGVNGSATTVGRGLWRGGRPSVPGVRAILPRLRRSRGSRPGASNRWVTPLAAAAPSPDPVPRRSRLF